MSLKANPYAHLMMRYHAPLDDFERHLKWVLKVCRTADIGEVIFMVDPEEYFMGFPELKRIREWIPVLQDARFVLNRCGIAMSLNPWVTLGHGGRGYRPSKKMGISAMMIGDDGTPSVDTACPADPGWQSYIAKSYALFASAEPNILWLEDDFRLHNHAGVRFGCFAKPMLEEFARRTGGIWEREALVDSIVAGNDATRSKWLQFTGDLWINIATHIRDAVHRVNPNVKLAQMTSSMGAHAVEGRRWNEYLAALSGPHRPITRPHFGPYRESSGFDFAVGVTLFRHALAFAGRQTRCCPEMENWPFSYYSKSRRQSRLMLELSQFFGCRDVTMDYFSMTGNDPANEPWVIEQIQKARPRMNALAALHLDRWVEQGVHVWTDPRAALVQQADGPTINALLPGFDGWAKALMRLGVASTFETKGSLTAVSGDTIRCADADEISRLLQGGLLLDGRAALALQEMGYGEHLGVCIERRFVPGDGQPYAMEQISARGFGLKGSPVMGIGLMGANWGECAIYALRLAGARAISTLECADGSASLPGMVLFKNALGGRVAVCPFDFDSGVPDSVRLYNHPRKYQIQSVLRWLNRGRPLMACPDSALVCVERCKTDRYELLLVMNLGGDPLKEIALEMPEHPQQIVSMNERGRWQSVQASRNPLVRVTPALPLESFEALFLRLSIDGNK